MPATCPCLASQTELGPHAEGGEGADEVRPQMVDGSEELPIGAQPAKLEGAGRFLTQPALQGEQVAQPTEGGGAGARGLQPPGTGLGASLGSSRKRLPPPLNEEQVRPQQAAVSPTPVPIGSCSRPGPLPAHATATVTSRPGTRKALSSFW